MEGRRKWSEDERRVSQRFVSINDRGCVLFSRKYRLFGPRTSTIVLDIFGKTGIDRLFSWVVINYPLDDPFDSLGYQ